MSEASFHRFWDDTIRSVFEFVNDYSTFNFFVSRNSSESSNSSCSITKKVDETDLLVYCENHVLFKGEEKGVWAKLEEAQKELVEKMRSWNPLIWGDVPFLLCYAAAACQVQFCAVTPNLDLITLSRIFDTSKSFDRLCVMQYTFQCARYIMGAVQLLPNTDLFQDASE